MGSSYTGSHGQFVIPALVRVAGGQLAAKRRVEACQERGDGLRMRPLVQPVAASGADRRELRDRWVTAGMLEHETEHTLYFRDRGGRRVEPSDVSTCRSRRVCRGRTQQWPAKRTSLTALYVGMHSVGGQ
jgi:hypothetical protein